MWDLLEGGERRLGLSYRWSITSSVFVDKALKEIVERILQTSYFDSTHNHQNGLCEEEEAAPAPAVEDTVAEAGKNMKVPCDGHIYLYCTVLSLWIHQNGYSANAVSLLQILC